MLYMDDEYATTLMGLVTDYAPQVALYNCAVAGGFLRDAYLGETPEDMDVFFYSKEHNDPSGETWEDAERLGLELIRDGWKIPQTMKHVVTLVKDGKTVQIRQVGDRDLESLVGCVDFTMCGIGLDMQTLTLCALEAFVGFEGDALARCLVIHKPMIPLLTLKRVGNFLERGWTIDGREITKLAALLEEQTGKTTENSQTPRGSKSDRDYEREEATQDYAKLAA